MIGFPISKANAVELSYHTGSFRKRYLLPNPQLNKSYKPESIPTEATATVCRRKKQAISPSSLEEPCRSYSITTPFDGSLESDQIGVIKKHCQVYVIAHPIKKKEKNNSIEW